MAAVRVHDFLLAFHVVRRVNARIFAVIFWGLAASGASWIVYDLTHPGQPLVKYEHAR